MILARDCPLLPEEQVKYDGWKAELNSLVLPPDPKVQESEDKSESPITEEDEVIPHQCAQKAGGKRKKDHAGTTIWGMKTSPRSHPDNSLGLNEEWLIQT